MSSCLEIKATTADIAEQHVPVLLCLTVAVRRLSLLLNFGAGSILSKRMIR